MELSTKGILHPARLPSFHRLPAPAPVADLVRWFWIPEWEIEPGRTSRQHVLSHPASNLVVQVDGVILAGPTTRRSHRDLTGTGWAVGALLRPALVPRLTDDPAALRDLELPLDLPELHRAVHRAMQHPDRDVARTTAVAAFVDWLRTWTDAVDGQPVLDEEARLSNRLLDVVEAAPGLTSLQDLAQELSVSPRTVQRLARKYVGLTPSVLVRRRRLQDAAERLRKEPGTEVATIAAELGYADHAHLTRDFRAVLGQTPSAYRRAASPVR